MNESILRHLIDFALSRLEYVSIQRALQLVSLLKDVDRL